MNALVPFENGSTPPAVVGRYTDNSMTRAGQEGLAPSFAVIGYKGRAWSIKYQGETEIQRAPDGVSPAPYLDVVIVGVSPAISKNYYDHAYVEGSDEAPDCWSLDGKAPDPGCSSPQSTTCELCPQNRWGSKITEAGKQAKACQDGRRIAVVPYGDMENEVFGGPMLLRLPPMSLRNFSEYTKWVERKGAKLPLIATRLSFNYDVAYPQITFKALGWLDDESAVQAVGADGQGGLVADPRVQSILSRVMAREDEGENDGELAGAPPAVAQQQPQPAAQKPVHVPPPPPPVQVAPAAPTAPAAPAAAPAPAPAAAPTPAAQRMAASVAPRGRRANGNGAAAPEPVKTPELAAAPADMMAQIDELLGD